MVERGQGDRVVKVRACELRVLDGNWDYALARSELIEESWLRSKAENPSLFNGTVYVMNSYEIVDDRLVGSFLKSNFKSYLYWRLSGFEDAGVWDGFGSGILRSKEGHVILGRQALGHVNAGLAYMPGGFIDTRDFRDDGRVDIDSSIVRELVEETGLDMAQTSRVPGYYLTFHGALVSIGVEFRSKLLSEEICLLVRRHISLEAAPELSDVVVAMAEMEIEQARVAPFAKPLLSAVLSSPTRKN